MTQNRNIGRGGPRIAQSELDGRTKTGKAMIEMIDDPATHKNVEKWAKVGMTKSSISAKLGIGISAFNKHFDADFQRGRFDSILAMRAKLFEIALRAKGHAAVLAWLRASGDVADRVEVTGKDGGPITVDMTEVYEGMTDEQLEIVGPFLDRLIAVAGGSGPSTTH